MMQQWLTFKSKVEIISQVDSFDSSKAMCNLAADGVIGIIGPSSVKTAPIIESTCLNMEIPHIDLSWRPLTSPNPYSANGTTVNFFPKTELLVKGIGEIVRQLQWRTFYILYENADSLIRLQDVLKLQEFNANSKQNTIIVKHLGSGPDYRPVLKDLRNITDQRIVLDCETENILNILEQAKELKLLEPVFRYFITSLDAHTVDFSVLDTKANITTIRLFNPEDQHFLRVLDDWNQYSASQGLDTELAPYAVTTKTALMNDALSMFTTAIQELHTTQHIKQTKLQCYKARQKSEFGFGLITFLKAKSANPLLVTGPIKFDSVYGNRINFTIYVIEGNRNQIEATWDPENLFRFSRPQEDRKKATLQKLTENVLVVSSRLDPPYLRKRKPKDGEILEGNQRYEGFSMDLIAALFDEMKSEFNFTFRFELAKDKKYGNYDEKTKSWNGLIKDILDGRAQLAICDLTITHQRREVVDFSTPFMRLGISILHKKSEEKNVSTFAFLAPYVPIMSICGSNHDDIFTRMSPTDWENPHPCEQNPEELENIWDIKNCLWLTLGAIMNQGCDILPKGISMRMAAAMWWFFAIIVTNSYMANLTAFLTTDKMESSINSAEDLAKQTKIKYGTLKGGSTETFFRDSNYSIYQRMWASMSQAKPSVFESNNGDGVNRVKNTKNGLYAYLMESTTLEYQLETQCDLKKVGDWLDSKGYGIAMPIDFELRSDINEAILRLQEKGVIKRLKNKWWKEMRDEPPCPAKDDEDEASEKLSLKELRGIFLVLAIGVALAYIVAILEFMWNVRNVSVEEHITYWQAFKIESLFALNVWVTKKKVKPKISESDSSREGTVTRSILQSC
ncbi:Lig chan, ANF receptor and/or SBP bac 3 domain containing protein, partial [Asbolus verrucosus]